MISGLNLSSIMQLGVQSLDQNTCKPWASSALSDPQTFYALKKYQGFTGNQFLFIF